MSKVSLTIDQLRNLADQAIASGTEDKIIELLLDIIEEMSERLQNHGE